MLSFSLSLSNLDYFAIRERLSFVKKLHFFHQWITTMTTVQLPTCDRRGLVLWTILDGAMKISVLVYLLEELSSIIFS